MRLVLTATTALFAVLTFGCDQESPSPVMLEVDHFREACPGGNAGYCLRVRKPGDKSFFHTPEIAGLEPEWGSSYEVMALPREDASSGEVPGYDLVSIIERTTHRSHTRFDMVLAPALIERVDREGFRMDAGTAALCETPEVCKAVADALYEGDRFTLEMSHSDAPKTTFIAHSVAAKRVE